MPLTLSDVVEAGGADGADGLVSHSSGKSKDAARVGHPNNREQVAAFLLERLHFYLKDVRGFAYDVVSAVLAAGADDVRDAIARAEALTVARGRKISPPFQPPSSASRTFCARPKKKDSRLAEPLPVTLAPEAGNWRGPAMAICAGGNGARQRALLR